MLTDFRNVLPDPFATADIGELGGNSVLDGVRSPVLGAVVSDLAGVDGGCSPDVFRVLETGNAGRAMVGGPLEGLLGFGSVIAISRTLKGYR